MPRLGLRDRDTGATRRSAVAYLLVVLLLLSVVSLAASAWRFEQNLKEVREAEGDNRMWNISQLEVDYQDFLIALQNARFALHTGGQQRLAAADADMRLEFDIFYSRITAFLATLRQIELTAAFEEDLATLVARRDAVAARVDALVPGDQAGLTELYELASPMEETIRRLTVDTLQSLVDRAEASRLREKNLLRAFLFETVFLLALTLISASLAVRLVRLIQHQSRETLRAQALVNKAFEGAQEGVLVCDRTGRILLSNPTARQIFRRSTAELEGHTLEETVVPRHRLRQYRRAMDGLLSGDIHGASRGLGPARFKGVRSDRALFDASVALRVEETVDGDLRVFVFVRDISERLAVEERLRLALREARKHAEARSRFLSTMSHEMRTPLHGVVASLDLLAADELDCGTQELLATARKCSERALQQIDYALDAIRSEDGDETPTEFDPVAAVRSIVAEMEPLAHGKGNELDMETIGFEGACRFVGRPKAYARTVFNLVGNAVKFTTDGRVSVTLHLQRGSGSGQLDLVTAVSDTGAGIAPEDRDRIFEPFEQTASIAASAANPGFGLGLAIVRQDLDRMSGRIELDSEEGRGSTFRFVVPLACAEHMERGGQEPARPAPPTVEGLPAPPREGARTALVVDDNDVNASLMARMLERLGYRVHCRHSGEEAVWLARSTRFALILMDLRMPGMNGSEAAGLIRAGGASFDADIVGITAQVDFGTSDAFRDSGMTSVLTKPFGLQDLARHLAERPQAVDDVPAGGAAERQIVEDISESLSLTGRDVGLALVGEVISDARAAVSAATEDVTLAEDRAHAAAGAALMMGLRDLGRALQELEILAREGEVEGLRLLLDEITRLTDLADAARAHLQAPPPARREPAASR